MQTSALHMKRDVVSFARIVNHLKLWFCCFRFSSYINPSSDWLSSVTDKDFILFPERLKPPPHVQNMIDTKFLTPMKVYLGQQTDDLRDVSLTEKFKPICLTCYFVSLYFCSKYAHMDTPMNPKFVQISSSRNLDKKENLILYDPQKELNISEIKVCKASLSTRVQAYYSTGFCCHCRFLVIK